MEAMDIKYNNKTVVFPNGGAAKKAKPPALGEPMYRECLKNHAASLGGHALDGCGEFMPSPGATTADPSSLKCAACGCHRNFHRRTVDGSTPPPLATAPAPLALPAPPVPAGVLHGQPQPQPRREETPEDRLPAVVDGDDSDSDSDASEYDEERSVSPPPPLLHHVPAPVAQQPPPPPPYYPSAPHMLLSLGSGAPGAAMAAAAGVAQRFPTPASAPAAPGGAAQRKRFRTKFTAEQKRRMQELSERLGWRLQKRDEAIVDEWCRDIGVGKGVFKVWMHNNKHNFLGGHSARRSTAAAAASVVAAGGPATSFQNPAPPAGSAPPAFHRSAASPPPPVLSSSPPGGGATGLININGAAANASAAPTAPAGHQENTNGSSSPQSA